MKHLKELVKSKNQKIGGLRSKLRSSETQMTELQDFLFSQVSALTAKLTHPVTPNGFQPNLQVDSSGDGDPFANIEKIKNSQPMKTKAGQGASLPHHLPHHQPRHPPHLEFKFDNQTNLDIYEADKRDLEDDVKHLKELLKSKNQGIGVLRSKLRSSETQITEMQKFLMPQVYTLTTKLTHPVTHDGSQPNLSNDDISNLFSSVTRIQTKNLHLFPKAPLLPPLNPHRILLPREP